MNTSRLLLLFICASIVFVACEDDENFAGGDNNAPCVADDWVGTFEGNSLCNIDTSMGELISARLVITASGDNVTAELVEQNRVFIDTTVTVIDRIDTLYNMDSSVVTFDTIPTDSTYRLRVIETIGVSELSSFLGTECDQVLEGQVLADNASGQVTLSLDSELDVIRVNYSVTDAMGENRTCAFNARRICGQQSWAGSYDATISCMIEDEEVLPNALLDITPVGDREFDLSYTYYQLDTIVSETIINNQGEEEMVDVPLYDTISTMYGTFLAVPCEYNEIITISGRTDTVTLSLDDNAIDAIGERVTLEVRNAQGRCTISGSK